MTALVDLTGKTFGSWTVVQRATNASDGVPRWNCICVCGSTRAVRGQHLRSGRSTSCGCSRLEANVTHGHTRAGQRHPMYDVWKAIVQRCTNPRNARYADYGGRGITLWPAWRSSFEAFLADVGERPSDQHSIDRIDNDRGYEPGNVRWATRYEQAQNTRKTNRKGTI